MTRLQLTIKIEPFEIPSGHGQQPWIRRIALIDDSQLEKTGDMTVGLFNCTRCDIYRPYTFKMPPEYVCYEHIDGCDDPDHANQRYKNYAPSREAHNEWVDFQLTHAHGDGRIALFERKI